MKQQTKQYLSPAQLAWQKLKANQLAIAGLFCILLFLLVAILGPLVRPDSSPKANQQHLELARKKAGFQIKVLSLPDRRTTSDQSFFEAWLWGKESQFREIPIYDYQFSTDGITIERFTGSQPNDGEKVFFAKESWTDVKLEYSEASILETKTFILGTDRYGRDLLSRLMAGTWISFTVGIIAILISLLIGISLGMLAAYYKGWLDELIMWFINVVWSIPTLLLVIAITLALGKGFWQVFVAVGLTMWVEVARVVRGQVMSVREMEYVEAGRSLGFRDFRIMMKHILPNVTGPIIVISASNFAAAILIEAGLSFLGLGAQPPQATWGKMISEHKGYIITGDAYLAIFPGLAICLLVLSFVLLGNGLRDAFDTKGVKGVNL
ncbi:MAG: ABC transporter permease [Vicingaceae bacterium]